ncbi:HAUS3 protein, partial [Todus mexicanus]|nr:HAUS3 protein [Todus mexicanus]
VSRGEQFVETLRLIYPHADTLCGKDFDWLFDCPQTKQFLEWFCSTVGKENVLSPDEVDAYDALLAAGKPILEGNALEQALQTCCQLPSMIPDDEGPSLEALQQELQELKDCCDRQLWQKNKLQVWAFNLQQQLRYLEEEDKAVKQDLKKAQTELEAEISQTRAVLSQISRDAKQMAEWYRDMGKGQPPARLCEMDLGPYMEQEQQATHAFESFLQQVLAETVQAPDAQGANGSQETTDRMDAKQTIMPKSLGNDGDELLEDQGNYWKELNRMKMARICAQREVILMSAKVEGHSAALEWAQRTLEALEKNQQTVKMELQNQAFTVQEQLHTLRGNIAHTLTDQLPPLLKAEAHTSCLPVLESQLSLEVAGQQGIARRQDAAAAWLVSQHSRLHLLELRLKWEEKELDQKAAQLQEMETAMKEAQTMLQERKDYFKNISSSQKGCPQVWIDPKDLYAGRLWDMVMGQDKEKLQLHSYKAMAAQCSQLVQNQKVLEAQLAAPLSQLPALESSTEALYRRLYNSSNQLQLSPPEITELMEKLFIMQDSLYKMLTDLQMDLKVKHKSLESPLLQTERKLYVYFYCNEARLREVVEELEKQVSATSR